MTLTVRLRAEQGLVAFTDPHRLLLARDAESALLALDAAEAALREGYWIAGYVCYELGATFVNGPQRATRRPLLHLGVFDAPRPEGDADRPFTLSPLLPHIDAEAYAAAIDANPAQSYDGTV